MLPHLSLIGHTSSSTSFSAQTQVTKLWSPQNNTISFRALVLSPCVSWSLGCGSNKHTQRPFKQQKVLPEDEQQASSEAKYFCLSFHFKRLLFKRLLHYECQPLILKASKTLHPCLNADFKLDQTLFFNTFAL